LPDPRRITYSPDGSWIAGIYGARVGVLVCGANTDPASLWPDQRAG
jgi:hypothetical protein